jgi:predicted flap endonuclease-1-like 5' DNA nuclease
VFEWVGEPGAYLNAVPARDLYPRDLMDLEAREGITAEDIEQSGLYVPVHLAEVEPFCGAVLDGAAAERLQPAQGRAEDGPPKRSARCRNSVAAWGLRCERHGALTVIKGIGPETAAVLRQFDVATTRDLAALSNREVLRIADAIPRVSEAMLLDWVLEAKEVLGRTPA